MPSLTLPFRHNLALLLTLYIVFFLTHSLLKFLSCTPLRSLSDSVLHLLLHSSLHSLSSLLSFFLFLHQYFLLSWSIPFSIPHFAFFTFSLLFSYFLPFFLLISPYLSFIVLLFDSPSLFHTPLPFSPSSTTFRWEVFHSTDDQKVITCSQLTAAQNQHIQQIDKFQCNIGKPFSFKNDTFVLVFAQIYLEKLSCLFSTFNRIELLNLKHVIYFNMLFDGTEFFLVQDF